MEATDRDQQPPPSDGEVQFDREQIAAWAREAAENLPDMETMMARWIDTSTFLDEDAAPVEEDEGE